MQHTQALKDFCRQVDFVDDPFLYIKESIGNGILSKADLEQLICDNRNLLDAGTVKQCVDEGLMDAEALVDGGIDRNFLDRLGTIPEDVLPQSGRIESIPGPTTEVYFWGIPSSGKTCALGTILAAARGGTVARSMRVEDCQGSLYQMKLSQIFKRENFYCTLPGRTPVDTNFAIRTVIEDFGRKDHPVTLIDMAGELFCSILWKKHGLEDNIKDNHLKALEEFEKMLVTNKSDNPKYHFFIIEYGEGEKKYKGFDQDTYLEYGIRFLSEKGVLSDAKNGLFVIVTKTDLVRRDISEDEDPNQYLLGFLNERYPNFFALLQQYCERNGICGGNFPPPIPFDIGEVCFKNYCQVKTERANEVVRLLLSPPKPQQKKRRWPF